MNIEVTLFASLKEAAGWSKKTFHCDEGADLSDLWDSIRAELGPVASGIKPLPVANLERVDWSFVPSEGDEIGFLPPLSGG